MHKQWRLENDSSFLVWFSWVLKDFILVMAMIAITFTPDAKWKKTTTNKHFFIGWKMYYTHKGQAGLGLFESPGPHPRQQWKECDGDWERRTAKIDEVPSREEGGKGRAWQFWVLTNSCIFNWDFLNFWHEPFEVYPNKRNVLQSPTSILVTKRALTAAQFRTWTICSRPLA